MSDETKLNMKLSLEVTGKEGMNISIEWKETSMEVVKLVENALMKTFADINAG